MLRPLLFALPQPTLHLHPLPPITSPLDTEIDLSGAGTPIGVALLAPPAASSKIIVKNMDQVMHSVSESS